MFYDGSEIAVYCPQRIKPFASERSYIRLRIHHRRMVICKRSKSLVTTHYPVGAKC